jgi:hypothetical protein
LKEVVENLVEKFQLWPSQVANFPKFCQKRHSIDRLVSWLNPAFCSLFSTFQEQLLTLSNRTFIAKYFALLQITSKLLSQFIHWAV